MAEIRRYPIVRHLRADAVDYVLHYRRDRVVRAGAGLSFWFNPMTDSLAEVPTADRELALVIHGRSSDFQDVTVNGIVTYRPTDPKRLAERVDFTIDPVGGQWQRQPVEKVALMLTQLAQEYALNFLTATPIKALLAGGVAPVRDAIEQGLHATAMLVEMGLEIVTVRVSAVAPSADLAKAIEAPMRESIKQEADEAAYARRALAVEKERAIAENEMQNKIELAKREEQLLEQQGTNARRQAEDAAEAAKIEAAAQAGRIKTVESAQGDMERERLDVLKAVAPSTLLAMAAREFAANVGNVEHLTITPEIVGALSQLLQSRAVP
jgi:regulator of protease activity HflC (stomatin/prohibitin superfamily)